MFSENIFSFVAMKVVVLLSKEIFSCTPFPLQVSSGVFQKTFLSFLAMNVVVLLSKKKTVFLYSRHFTSEQWCFSANIFSFLAMNAPSYCHVFLRCFQAIIFLNIYVSYARVSEPLYTCRKFEVSFSKYFFS